MIFFSAKLEIIRIKSLPETQYFFYFFFLFISTNYTSVNKKTNTAQPTCSSLTQISLAIGNAWQFGIDSNTKLLIKIGVYQSSKGFKGTIHYSVDQNTENTDQKYQADRMHLRIYISFIITSNFRSFLMVFTFFIIMSNFRG